MEGPRARLRLRPPLTVAGAAQVGHRARLRDRLLELASSREAREETLREALAAADADLDTEDFILRLFEQFGIEHEETGPRTWVLDPE